MFATNPEVAEVAGETGKQLGLNVEPKLVERSFADLERQAKEVRARKDTLGSYARSYGGIETENNRFVIAVTPAQRALVETTAKEAGVTLIERRSTPKTEYDAGCTSRSACDWTIRAGSMIWNPSAGNNNCSVGFTARNSANARFTYTAGHCSSGATLWGTGGQSIGTLSSARNSGPVDAAIIPVTNPWFKFDSGGEIYNEFFPGRTVAVNAVAPTLSLHLVRRPGLPRGELHVRRTGRTSAAWSAPTVTRPCAAWCASTASTPAPATPAAAGTG